MRGTAVSANLHLAHSRMHRGDMSDPLIPSSSRGTDDASDPAVLCDSDDIVEAVLDLYKRSLEHTRSSGNAEGLSFAGSFASLNTRPLESPGPSAAVLLCSAGPFSDHLLYDGQAGNQAGGPQVAGRSGAMTSTVLSHERLEEVLLRFRGLGRDALGGHIVWFHSLDDAALFMISSVVSMHPVAQRLFGDSSPQSVVNHLDQSSVVITGVTVYVEGRALRAQKVSSPACVAWAIQYVAVCGAAEPPPACWWRGLTPTVAGDGVRARWPDGDP